MDAQFRISIQPSTSIKIVSVIPSDYDGDGCMDVMLILQLPSQEDYSMRLYYGNHSHVSSVYKTLNGRSRVQPFALDYQGMAQLDLMGANATQGALIWRNMHQDATEKIRDHDEALFEVIQAPFLGDTCTLVSPHANAFVDMDGDCVADLVVQCADGSVQVWLNRRGEFVFYTSFKLNGVMSMVFADINGDGSHDVVYTSCETDTQCFLNVIYNQQMPLCSKHQVEGRCRSVAGLCLADDQFVLNVQEQQRISLSALNTTLTGWLRDSDKMAVPLQVGDVNLDGYPDILAVVQTSQGSRAVIFENTACTPSLCPPSSSWTRTMQYVASRQGSLDHIYGVSRAAFYDLDEKGILDVVLQYKNNSMTSPSLAFILNNLMSDALFLKATTINNGPKSSRGVNYIGSTYKFTVMDIHGQKRAAIGTSMTQSAHCPLQLPYHVHGLGRTNTYLEEFVVGVPRRQEEQVRSWAGVIPNSQVFMSPYQPAGVKDASTWTLRVYINPSEYAVWVLVVVLVSTMVLAAVVVGLHKMEVNEDEAEKKSASHHINFDAL